MTEPQVWTLIGVFAATMIGVMTFLSQSVTHSIASLGRELGARIDSLRAETNTRFDAMQAEMSARFEAVDVKFERVHAELDHLNRDVQAIARHIHPE